MIDPNEFEVFVKNYQDMVYSTAIRLVANPADVAAKSQAAATQFTPLAPTELK